jgi:hypothetical protein
VSCCFGQITFQKTYGGDGYYRSSEIRQTKNGDYVLCGSGHNNSDTTDYNIYVIRTTSIGDTIWMRQYGGVKWDEGSSIVESFDGGFALTGYTSSYGAGKYDVFLIKIDSNGNFLWSKTYGGTEDDEANSIVQTSDSGFVIAGWTKSFGSGGSNDYLIKTDGNGDTLWTKTYGGNNEDASSICQTHDGGFAITGNTWLSGSAWNVSLIKIDSAGNILWANSYGGNDNDWANSIAEMSDGGFVMGGGTVSFGGGYTDCYLLKTDASGNLLWSKTFGGVSEDEFRSVYAKDNGQIICVGVIDGQPGSWAGTHLCLVEFDSNGNIFWTKAYNPSLTDECYFVTQASDNGIVVSGEAGYQMYFIKSDSLGNSGCNEYIFDSVITSPSTVEYSEVTTTSSGSNINAVNMLLWQGGDVQNICSSIGINEISNPDGFHLYPNPIHSSSIINLPSDNLYKTTLKIYNTLGSLVKEQIISGQSAVISREGLENGIYFIRVSSDEGEWVGKVVVE